MVEIHGSELGIGKVGGYGIEIHGIWLGTCKLGGHGRVT